MVEHGKSDMRVESQSSVINIATVVAIFIINYDINQLLIKTHIDIVSHEASQSSGPLPSTISASVVCYARYPFFSASRFGFAMLLRSYEMSLVRREINN